MKIEEIYQQDLEKIRNEFHLKFEPPEVLNFSPTILATAWHDDYFSYKFRGITRDDIVLDIGAETGMFSLLAAKMGAKKVYAVEAISQEWIIENIRKNKLEDKIELLPFAFGKNGIANCPHHFQGPILTEIESHDLEYIFENIDDKITVIKCDCEGFEWDGFRNVSNFRKVRKIDMEAHILNNDKREMYDLIKKFKKNGFIVTHTILSYPNIITLTDIHAKK